MTPYVGIGVVVEKRDSPIQKLMFQAEISYNMIGRYI